LLKTKIMAKQKGILKLEGTIGDITFYKSQDGFLAKGKGGISGDRIANDPKFQRTRENGSEFGSAGKAGKVLRNSLRVLLQNSSDNRMVSRLTKKMVEVIQADLTSVRGQRNVIDGEAELLEGFEFNINAKLGNTMYAPYTPTIDRVTGAANIAVPSFIPANMVAAPGGTTHFKLVASGVSVDFENEVFEALSTSSAVLAWDGTATNAINLNHALTANSAHPLFLAFGVEFFQDVNGVKYPLKNGAYNALSIVKVDGV
jgi:hypothetical protein